MAAVNMRLSFLTSFDLFSDTAAESPEPAEMSLYKHPLDPRVTRYTRFTQDSKSLDLYGLGVLLLEIGLWTSIWEIFPDMAVIPNNPADVFKQLSTKCGTVFMKAVQACWKAPDEELAQRTRPDVMHQKLVLQVSKALDACCAIDRLFGDEEESEDILPIAEVIPENFIAQDHSGSKFILQLPEQPTEKRELEKKEIKRKEVGSGKPLLLDTKVDSNDWAERCTPNKSILAKASKPKLRTYPAIPISQEHLDYWHNGLMPHINHVLRGFYKKYPETVEISLESIGESSTTTKPTILVICTNVNKMRSVLKNSLVYDQATFGLKVCRGKVVRSRKRGVKRSMAVSEAGRPANGDYQERPLNGASIGAYVGERHLPPVSFGGLIMVDDKPYGMTVHHMLDDLEDDEDDMETSAPILRSSAHGSDLPDLTYSDSSVYSSGDEEYMYELSDCDSDFSEAESDTSEFDMELGEEVAGSFEPGDIEGIPQGCGEGYFITQPAIDDIDDDFYPSAETKDEDHLVTYPLGEVYASSGIRRRVENETVHEIDWALFKFDNHREPLTNYIENGHRYCPVKDAYPSAVAPSTFLSELPVHCMARTSGLQSGRIMPGMVIVKFYGRQTPSSSYQVVGRLGIPGDSGAWIVDNEYGRACGHVLAWSSKKRVAYMCPMDVLIRDIGETLNARSISFPGGANLLGTKTSPSLASDLCALSHHDPAAATAKDPVDVADELADIMRELNIPSASADVEALASSLTSSYEVGRGSQKTFMPIHMMARADESVLRKMPPRQQQEAGKAA